MQNLIVKNYTKALFNILLKQENIIDIVDKELIIISTFFRNKELIELLKSPFLTREKKQNLILDLIDKNSQNILIEFIQILSEKDRLVLFPFISKEFSKMLRHEKKEYTGIIISEVELIDEDIKSLELSLEEKTKFKISLSQKQSKDINGFKVFIKDLGVEIDFSKEKIKKELIDFITKSLEFNFEEKGLNSGS